MLEKYNKFWYEVSNTIKVRFDAESVYNEKYLKTKIKSYEVKTNTDVYNDKIPQEGFHCICLSVYIN